MRGLLFVIYASLILPLRSQIVGTAFSKAQQEGTGELIFVYNEVSGFTEQKGDVAEGLLVDLMIEFEKYVKEQKGVSLSHKFVYANNDFPAFMKQVKNAKGGVFGLGNVSIKEERKGIYDFSPPFLDNMSLLVTNSKVSTLNSMDEISSSFSGMKGYSIASTTNDERIQEIKKDYLPQAEITYFNSTNEVLDGLLESERAFAIIDLNFYLEALNARMPIKRHAVGDRKDDPFGIVMPKNSDWTPVMREFFDSGFVESSRYSEIIAKNLGNSALRLLSRVKNQ